MESLCLPKINTKTPTRTNSVEMSKIVSNSEIHFWFTASVNRGLLKLEKATTGGVQ